MGSPKNFNYDPYSHIKVTPVYDPPPQIRRQNYNRTILPPPPEHYLLQYIGGPFNGEQEYLVCKDHPSIENQSRFTKAVTPPLDLNNLGKPSPLETFTYTLTFIPSDQTPFSEAQVVIALFSS